jgi:hypothetical protein
MTRAKRRRWADIAVIVAAVYALLAVVWSPPELFSGGEGYEVQYTGWLIIAYTGAAVLGFAGLLVGQKWQTPGRILTAVAGLLALSGLVALRPITALGLLSLGGTGLLLLGAAPFMGEMPAPHQEKAEERRT